MPPIGAAYAGSLFIWDNAYARRIPQHLDIIFDGLRGMRFGNDNVNVREVDFIIENPLIRYQDDRGARRYFMFSRLDHSVLALKNEGENRQIKVLVHSPTRCNKVYGIKLSLLIVFQNPVDVRNNDINDFKKRLLETVYKYLMKVSDANLDNAEQRAQGEEPYVAEVLPSTFISYAVPLAYGNHFAKFLRACRVMYDGRIIRVRRNLREEIISNFANIIAAGNEAHVYVNRKIIVTPKVVAPAGSDYQRIAENVQEAQAALIAGSYRQDQQERNRNRENINIINAINDILGILSNTRGGTRRWNTYIFTINENRRGGRNLTLVLNEINNVINDIRQATNGVRRAINNSEIVGETQILL